MADLDGLVDGIRRQVDDAETATDALWPIINGLEELGAAALELRQLRRSVVRHFHGAGVNYASVAEAVGVSAERVRQWATHTPS